ncbi:hypothetical protein [Metamycoplasma gateae]|uniref:Transmembrane protein n=1 Tax=Metamycoplasma gateae TaxID=35769 RepID=A0ABZ2AIP8_9BACT|nr:hypothetical protein V2E26_01535 [Metamycoplasma gateae]
MSKILNAQKQKDTRTLKYDPESDSISKVITEFQAYKKNAKFYKNYSEMDVFSFFQKIRFMKIMDERNKDLIDKTKKRQKQLRAKYQNYKEFEKWSESPLAETTKPISKSKRIILIIVFVLIQIILLTIILALTGKIT